MAYSFVLDDNEKRELLRIARATLKEFLISGRIPPGAPHRPSLVAPAGTFVTLHLGDKLRGCIGTATETQPLYKAIQEMTIAAASRDPRHEPIAADEIPGVTIEISVLGERVRVRGPEEIEIGRHGLTIAVGGRRGLLLPGVAVTNKWDASTFLARTCEKAGVAPDAWRDAESVIEAFPAQVFNDRDLPPPAGSIVNPIRR